MNQETHITKMWFIWPMHVSDLGHTYPLSFLQQAFVYTKCPLVSKLLGWIMSTERWDFVGTTGLVYKLNKTLVPSSVAGNRTRWLL